MLKYNIREPNDNEISRCINVLYSAFGRVVPNDVNEHARIWKALIKHNIGKFLISVVNEKIFGIGGVFIFGKVGSFGYMAVLPEYRGKGIGTAIFKNLLEIANKKNCESMFLYASKLGRPVYKKFDFQERFYGIMYQLTNQLRELQVDSNSVKVLEYLPKWLLALDKKAIGYDRKRYLELRIEFGAKILAVENEGYGLLAKNRLGPLIATNQVVAQQIIKKSVMIGSNHVIIANHTYLPKTIIKSMNLVEEENNASIKMVRGKELSENLSLIYAIGTYAKG
ncbi:MAG: GNAT family N-acetyltransferase [Promethearchaeota archaeon]